MFDLLVKWGLEAFTHCLTSAQGVDFLYFKAYIVEGCAGRKALLRDQLFSPLCVWHDAPPHLQSY